MRIARRVPFALFLILFLARCATAPERITLHSAAAYSSSRPTNGVTTFDLNWVDPSRGREVPVRFYLPTSPGPHPLILFSHGLANSRQGYRFLGEFWSAHGYVVVHVQHHGSDSDLLHTRGPLALYRASKSKQHWRDRPLDIRFVLDRLAQIERGESNDPREASLRGVCDFEQIGIGGHSYGAFTALTMAGMIIDFGSDGGLQGFRDPRIKSAIAMSMPKIAASPQAYAPIRIPILHMTGTRDQSRIFHTTAADRLVPFQQITHSAQTLVVIQDAGHSSFSDDERHPSANRDAHVRLMQETTLAFWDATLRNDGTAALWLTDSLRKFGGNGIATFERTGPQEDRPAQ